MNDMADYGINFDPNYGLPNKTPYSKEPSHSQEGQPYMADLAGRSTLVSDSVEMTKRLREYVPRSSAKQGLSSPNDLGYSHSAEEQNKGNYKSYFQ